MDFIIEVHGICFYISSCSFLSLWSTPDSSDIDCSLLLKYGKYVFLQVSGTRQ